MTHPDKPAKDLLSLAKASVPELIDALKDERTLSDEGGDLPARSLQITELIAAETVRLIRLGNRAELTEARLELTQAIARDEIASLAERQPRAHRLLIGSSVALAFATAPSSSGGELAVLRSWNGMAAKIVALVEEAPEQSLRRAQLREQLGVDESHLSHLLADLEAANLITRRRSGREVTVHLGRAGRSKHVGEFLRGVGGEKEPDSETPQEVVQEAFRQVLAKAGQPAAEPECPALQPLEREAAELSRELTLMHHEVSSVEKGWITCRLNIWGTTDAGGGKVDKLDDHYLFWAAKVENGEIVKAKSLAPPGRWFQAVQSKHGQSSELPAWQAPNETHRVPEWRLLDYGSPASAPADKGNVEKLSYSELVTLNERNGDKPSRGTHKRLADPLLAAAGER